MTQLQRFQDALKNSEFDAALISSELNQRYISGFNYTDGYILIGREKAYLLTDFRYIEAAHAEVKDFEILMPNRSMLVEIAELIGENGYKKIAIEDAELSCKMLEAFREKMPEGAELVFGASAILTKQRMVKLPYELERIAKAQEITDLAFEHILGFINPNVTEIEVALELEFFMRRHGAEALAFDTIAVSGPASSLPHGVPTNVKLRAGFLTMDYGAKYEGYCSDMTRTVVIGKADEEIKKVYNTVLTAQKAALEQIHGGMLCRDADEIARSIIRDAGYGEAFGHSLGHGVGMFIHESPSLAGRAPETSVLEAGNVVTVEPGIYLAGKYGCRIEDMIAINEDGSIRDFTKSPKELIELC
jgi:Xaa-Pro aminopeptidase